MHQILQDSKLERSSATFFTCGGHSCKINFVTPEIAHIKYCFSPEVAPHRSYAVVTGPEQNGVAYLQDEQTLLPCIPCNAQKDDRGVQLFSDKLRVSVQADPFAITVTDENGRLLHEDIAGRAYYEDGNGRRNHYFALGGYDGFYGFGEKGGALNKYKRRLRLYSCDTLGYDSELTDPLYKHIPFFIKRHAAQKTVCGVFYDCTHQGVLDMGCERSGYWPPYASLCVDGGDIDYYIISGKNMPEIVRGYTLLTGKTRLPTYQSLGYMASTMYYTEQDKNCDKGVQSFLEELERQGFACDGFHMSSGYTTCEGKRCVFYWNHERFPAPEAFFEWMNRRGVLVSPNIKPALLTEHPYYHEFAQSDAFLTDAITGKPYLERYWGGMASFVDFTSAAGRTKWKQHVTQSLLEKGATALWDDNNEYELSSPLALCQADGNTQPAFSLKPVFSNLMAKTGLEAMYEHNAALRPYILSRSGYAGIQRYAQTWAGDNYTSWNNLKYNIPVMLGMGLSGVANQGCDISGFQGPSPDAELFVRWVENGIFQPRFCIHSCNTDNTVTQPWSYTSHIPHIRSAFALRYALGLYLYACFRISNTLGDPVMRPLVYEFEQDAHVANSSFDFMFGPYLLVANVLEAGALTRTVYLPCGTCWYDWHTHTRYEGGTTVTVDAPLGKIPLFYRAGTILPLIAPAFHMEMQNTKTVRLLIEATQAGCFTLYQDDGRTNDYQTGAYVETTVSTAPTQQDLVIAFKKQGEGSEFTKQFEVELICRSEAPLAAHIDETALPVCLDKHHYDTLSEALYFEMDTRHVHVKFLNRNGNFSLRMDYAIKDLIGM